MQGSLMGLVQTLEFKNAQRSEDSFSFTENKRLAHNLRITGSIDLSFGMQGSLMGLV